MLTVRPLPGSTDDRQFLAGHDRKIATEQARLVEVPCRIKSLAGAEPLPMLSAGPLVDRVPMRLELPPIAQRCSAT